MALGRRRLLRIGVCGTAVTALCCFTPVLVIGLGAVGLSSLVGALDFVLLPMLAVFVCVTAYAFFARTGTDSDGSGGGTP